MSHPLQRDCDREIDLINFIEKEQVDLGADFAYDNFFQRIRNTAEKVELRDYMESETLPAFHSGACDLPKIVRVPDRTVNITDYEFNMIREQGDVTGCKVDEERVDERGDYFAPGRRFDRSFNRESVNLFNRVRKTKWAQSWELLKYGAYGVYSSPTNQIGALDFGRVDTLKNLDISGTKDDWCENKCSEPSDTVENIAREMSRCQVATGIIDVIHSASTWEVFKIHDAIEAHAFNSTRRFGGLDSQINDQYRGVLFQGETNGGRIRHWLSTGEYFGSDHVKRPFVEDGHILVVTGGFGGLDLINPWSVDYREILPDGVDFFLNENYEPKCRKTEIWLEHRHLLLPRNVNGAALVKVLDPDTCEPCKDC